MRLLIGGSQLSNINKNRPKIKAQRQFLALTTLSGLFLGVVADIAIVYNGIVLYSYLAKALAALTVVIVLLMSMLNKYLLFASYVGGSLLVNIVSFSWYVASLSYLNLDSSAARILLISTFFIIELALLTKRIVLKNPNYIEAVRTGKHTSYFGRGILFAFILAAILITLSVFLSEGSTIFLSQSSNTLIHVFVTLAISLIGIVGCITGLANYLYSKRNFS